MSAITSELEALRDAIETDEDNATLRQTARDLCSKAEEVEADNKKLEDQVIELQEEVEQQSAGVNMEHLRLRYPRLFTGDLSKMDYSERVDFFQAIAAFQITGMRGSDAERTLARIDGKL